MSLNAMFAIIGLVFAAMAAVIGGAAVFVFDRTGLRSLQPYVGALVFAFCLVMTGVFATDRGAPRIAMLLAGTAIALVLGATLSLLRRALRLHREQQAGLSTQ